MYDHPTDSSQTLLNPPNGPWPSFDFDVDSKPNDLKLSSSSFPECPPDCTHKESPCLWGRYPGALFPNWTPDQIHKSGLGKTLNNRPTRLIPITKIYALDVDTSGECANVEDEVVVFGDVDKTWKNINEPRSDKNCVRALFLENVTGPVLQMIGTRYFIDPSFFTSLSSRIPSQYWQVEGVFPLQKDEKATHITITLTYLRALQGIDAEIAEGNQSYLRLSNGSTLSLDLLVLHMVRIRPGSTIISYHPPNISRTSAKSLHFRILSALQIDKWKTLISRFYNSDFMLPIYLWHVLYAWDEALQMLYMHIGTLEERVLEGNTMNHTHEVHNIRAHLLNYTSFLQDFRESVQYVIDNPSPWTGNWAADAMSVECNLLLSEIARLQKGMDIPNKRLKNLINTAFSTANIALTEAAVRDSQAMKQISYLTMVFLPASFVASIFGMNVKELSPNSTSVTRYVAASLALTVFTVWIIVALQIRNYGNGGPGTEMGVRARLLWPAFVVRRWYKSLGKDYTTLRPSPRAGKIRKEEVEGNAAVQADV